MSLSAFPSGESVGPQAVAATNRDERPEQVFWRRYFEFYDTLNESILYSRMIDRNIELLDPSPEDFVLDAGTGTGNVAQGLSRRCSHVTGIDFCESALVKCRQKVPAGDFRFGDLTQRLDLDEASFDKVVSCNVIYTLPPEGQRNAVRELFRVLKPGGRAVITVFGSGFSALRVYIGTFRSQSAQTGFWHALGLALRNSIATIRILYYVARIKRQTKVGAYTFFTPEELRKLLESAGFEVNSIEPTFASQCLIIQAHKPQQPAFGGSTDSK